MIHFEKEEDWFDVYWCLYWLETVTFGQDSMGQPTRLSLPIKVRHYLNDTSAEAAPLQSTKENRIRSI